MAKRKRLTPARVGDTANAPDTKSMFPRYPEGVYRPPIADVAHDAATTAALTEVTAELNAARTQGRLIQNIALDQIDADYLVRDRISVETDDMEALIASLRARGQQTAIEITALDGGRYGLISGWRRLTALRKIQSLEGSVDSALAIVRHPTDAADAYVAMVEENEIRVGLSHYERARIVARAVDRGVYDTDKAALSALFHAVPRAKRSKIGSFVRIVRALDDDIRFPTSLSERAGLALVQSLDTDATLEGRLRAALAHSVPATAQAEAGLIAAVLAPKKKPADVFSPSGTQLRTGLTYRRQSGGRIVLEGPCLSDPDYVDRLLAMLVRLD